MRRILVILMVAALMASVLAFGSAGVAFAQDEPAVLADNVTEDEKCADLVAQYEKFVVEGNAEKWRKLRKR
jgi:hypothetical protein